MKRLILALALTSLSFTGTVADGLHSWSGLYIGTHVGWERGEVGGTGIDPFVGSARTTSYSQDINGVLAGAQIGVNHQIGRTVLGLELSGSWANASGSKSGVVPGTSTMPAACFGLINTASAGRSLDCHDEQNWTVQLLTKFGYAIGDGRFLPYATGGVAFTELSSRTTSTVLPAPSTPKELASSKTLLGVVLGGGFQYALGQNISVGAEYLYARYALQDVSAREQFNETQSRDLSTQTARLVVNYRLSD